MKLWEERLVDLYLLLNDILDNQYAQQHGYKSSFYYTFNPHLPYLRTKGDYVSQLMLLKQLSNRGALQFEARDLPTDLSDSFISVNAAQYAGQTVRLSIKALKFAEVLKELKKYGQRAATKAKHASKSAKFDIVTGMLLVSGFTIKFQTNASMYDLLRMTLKDREARTQDWSYEEARHHLSKSDSIAGDSFMRNTGNNINRRIAKETNGAIPKFLRVTTKSIRLDSQFV